MDDNNDHGVDNDNETINIDENEHEYDNNRNNASKISQASEIGVQVLLMNMDAHNRFICDALYDFMINDIRPIQLEKHALIYPTSGYQTLQQASYVQTLFSTYNRHWDTHDEAVMARAKLWLILTILIHIRTACMLQTKDLNWKDFLPNCKSYYYDGFQNKYLGHISQMVYQITTQILKNTRCPDVWFFHEIWIYAWTVCDEAAEEACWHTGAITGTPSTALMCFLLMSP